nr:receptor-like protein 12 [Ipomoea batatas]
MPNPIPAVATVFDPIDRTNPLYLHPNESPALHLVTAQLEGRSNYPRGQRPGKWPNPRKLSFVENKGVSENLIRSIMQETCSSEKAPLPLMKNKRFLEFFAAERTTISILASSDLHLQAAIGFEGCKSTPGQGLFFSQHPLFSSKALLILTGLHVQTQGEFPHSFFVFLAYIGVLGSKKQGTLSRSFSEANIGGHGCTLVNYNGLFILRILCMNVDSPPPYIVTEIAIPCRKNRIFP